MVCYPFVVVLFEILHIPAMYSVVESKEHRNYIRLVPAIPEYILHISGYHPSYIVYMIDPGLPVNPEDIGSVTFGIDPGGNAHYAVFIKKSSPLLLGSIYTGGEYPAYRTYLFVSLDLIVGPLVVGKTYIAPCNPPYLLLCKLLSKAPRYRCKSKQQ